jgi:hypothetical protein
MCEIVGATTMAAITAWRIVFDEAGVEPNFEMPAINAKALCA